ncbi:hypothetical protein [Parahaliea mediterranea]|uniref:DUF2232 domain-containing protein n=1 Tax=Parahaliea mediterranea TaxID=651086 RepID=A0A939DDD8_9GAMM|nr:hypothetical protein [Parahaliea mediterranea]MBN7795517.1 hypothetical protein [Parahaliea mediterranea]
MKGLAEFVMRGRLQALLVTVAGAGSLMLCWISAAVLALVTLRRGAGQGAWLLLWALLPAGTLMLVFGDSGPLALLVSTMALALVLRATVSLPLAVLASVPLGALTGLGLLAFGQGMLDQMVGFFDEFITNLEQQLSSGEAGAVQLLRPTAVQVAGMMGAANGLLSIACLLLARWWQAALYNPGGFAEEFRALYLPPAVTLALTLAAVALASLGVEYRTWAVICLIPLNFAGLALVHARAAWRGRGGGWLTAFYLLWLFFDPVKLLVVGFAIADSWLRFRQRWVRPGGDDSRQ